MSHPMRIVSLVPSLTEFLYDLGLDKQIVGRTRFCIHPKDRVDRAAIVGGTKYPNHARIAALRPDLVIANREENRREDVEAIAAMGLPGGEEAVATDLSFEKEAATGASSKDIDGNNAPDILITDIETIDQALQEMIRIGIRCGREAEARRWVDDIQKRRPIRGGRAMIGTVYLIWKDPWMTIGHDTYIHSVLEEWGFRNLFGEHKRYPTVTLDEIRRLRPSCLLLSSEPYPFKEAHRAMLAEQMPGTAIRFIDGEWTSWYGSRMKQGFDSLTRFREEFERDMGMG